MTPAPRPLLRCLPRLFVSLLLAGASSGCRTPPHAAPVAPAAGEGAALAAALKAVTRQTQFRLVAATPLDFAAHHPQGMLSVAGATYVSSVELLEAPRKLEAPLGRYDRTPGRGVGHLFRVDANGQRTGDVRVGEGDIYHPGGIAFDGRSIWVPVAEYRPNSHSIVYRVDPQTMAAEEAFRVDDHIGALVFDEGTGELYGMSWGSRTIYRFARHDGKILRAQPNPSHAIDFQHCVPAGPGLAACGGIVELPIAGRKVEVGGLALLKLGNAEIVHEVPLALYSQQGHAATRNPFFIERTPAGLKLYAAPDDDRATLYVYETP